MDRFVIRNKAAVSSSSSSSFSSDKPPTNSGGANKHGSLTASSSSSLSAAKTPNAGRKLLATNHNNAPPPAGSPSVRDAQLMRIFQQQPASGAAASSTAASASLSLAATAARNRIRNNNNNVAVAISASQAVAVELTPHSTSTTTTTTIATATVAAAAAGRAGLGDVFTFSGRSKAFGGGGLLSSSSIADPYNQENQSPNRLQKAVASSSLASMATSSHTTLMPSGRINMAASSSPAVKVHASSASATIRAIQAQRPDAPQYFDVPTAEQDIRTADELAAAQRPPPATIQEVMKSVRVYVEVRSGADNRSHGIKTIIAELGAAVNDRLLRNTTHVIFKDGLLSTYQKARNWGIPVVSILWIEACRRQICLLDPARFAISNVERYEQPELYEKIRKQKSMQPYAEETRRRVVPKPAAAAAATATASAASQHRVSVPRKPKDNLPGIFGDFVNTLQEHGVTGVPKNSKLMDIIRNSPMAIGGRPAVASQLPPAANDESVLASASASASASSASSTRRTLFRRSASTEPAGTLQLNKTPVRRSARRQSMLSSMELSTPAAVVEAVIHEESSDGVDMELSMNNDQFATPKAPPQDRDKKPSGSALLSSVLRRNTMYTPQAMQETQCGGATAAERMMDRSTTPTGSSSSAMRRRTMFTPSQGDESAAQRLERLMSDDGGSTSSASGHTLADNADSSPIASSTMVPISDSIVSVSSAEPTLSGPTGTPVFGVVAATIFEEYSRTVAATPPAFSSVRTPASHKRRTIFDMSMEILDQRLQNINRQAMSRQNRSMSESDLAHGAESKDEDDGRSRPVPPALESTESCDATLMSATSSGSVARKQLGPILETPGAAAAATPNNGVRKRKLYAPSSPSNFGFFRGDGDDDDNAQHSSRDPAGTGTQGNDAKRHCGATHQAPAAAAKTPSKAKKAPRKPTATSSQSLLAANRRRTTMDLMGPKKTSTATATQRTVEQQPQSITGCLVSTNMHQEQIAQINEAVRQLGGFTQESTVTARSTHLVSLEPLRTVNFLRGLIRGLWILRYDWIVASQAAGRWLPEEPFEVRDFSEAVSMCRSERQSFGARYRMSIFADVAAMCIVEASCACPNLRELVTLCGGRVTDDRNAAKYVISDEAVPVRLAGHRTDAVGVRSVWILDSISIGKVKKCHAYLW